MRWTDLRKCNIDDIVGYINEKIIEHSTLTKVAETLNTNESTIRRYLTNKGYRRVKNEFVLLDDTCNTQSNTSKEDKKTIDDTCNTQSNQAEKKEITKSNTDVINVPDIKENMLFLSKEVDTIRSMIEWFKTKDDISNTDVIEVIGGINIDLPESEIKRTTIRINEIIWNEFDLFVERHRPYEKHTLMAQALKEYMEKHN